MKTKLKRKKDHFDHHSKQHGFTVIEIMAVLIVLVVLAFIAIPIIFGVIDQTKKNAFRSSAYGIIASAEQYQAFHLEGDLTVNEFFFDFSKPVDLQFKGDRPVSGDLKIYRNGKTDLAIYNGTWCAKKLFYEEEVSLLKTKAVDCNIEHFTWGDWSDWITGTPSKEDLADPSKDYQLADFYNYQQKQITYDNYTDQTDWIPITDQAALKNNNIDLNLTATDGLYRLIYAYQDKQYSWYQTSRNYAIDYYTSAPNGFPNQDTTRMKKFYKQQQFTFQTSTFQELYAATSPGSGWTLDSSRCEDRGNNTYNYYRETDPIPNGWVCDHDDNCYPIYLPVTICHITVDGKKTCYDDPGGKKNKEYVNCSPTVPSGAGWQRQAQCTTRYCRYYKGSTVTTGCLLNAPDASYQPLNSCGWTGEIECVNCPAASSNIQIITKYQYYQNVKNYYLKNGSKAYQTSNPGGYTREDSDMILSPLTATSTIRPDSNAERIIYVKKQKGTEIIHWTPNLNDGDYQADPFLQKLKEGSITDVKTIADFGKTEQTKDKYRLITIPKYRVRSKRYEEVA